MRLKRFGRCGMPGRVLVLAIVLCCAATYPAAAGPTNVKATVESGTVRIGSTVTVTVRINRARDVGSAPFTLLYDPAILEFVDATSREGGFLRQNRATTAFIARGGSPSRGGGVVVGHSRLDAAKGANGKGILCRLTFRAIAPGQSQLTFSRAKLLTPQAQPIDSKYTGTTVRVRPAS